MPNQCNPLSAQFWDYKIAAFTHESNESFPHALAKAVKKDKIFKGCTPVPDYSRYAVDPNQDMTLQLMLVGTNGGYINYNKIDATKLPSWLRSFITAGGDPTPPPSRSCSRN